MTLDHRRFGQYEISILRDGIFEAPSDVLMHIDGDEARRATIEAWGKPKIRMDVNCFALRGPEGLMLIDAGTGNTWGAALGHARAAMHEAGIRAEQVDRVLLTHLHGDHALGLFEDGAAYFPHAEVLVPESDLAYFTDARAREATPEAWRETFDIAERLQRLYGGRLRKVSAGPVLPGIDRLPLPGHTPGHSGYLVGNEVSRLLIWADALHLGDIQPADPKIGLIYDLDSPTAAVSRHTALQQAADNGWTVAGSHVGGFNRVHHAGNGFRIEAV
jgi:glyoxylase-like metal-dependent hydrolase (beta-lactamase superfamily II)